MNCWRSGRNRCFLVVLAKVIAYWLTTGLPLLILAPVIAVMLNLDTGALSALMGGLLLGTPTLALVGAQGRPCHWARGARGC